MVGLFWLQPDLEGGSGPNLWVLISVSSGVPGTGLDCSLNLWIENSSNILNYVLNKPFTYVFLNKNMLIAFILNRLAKMSFALTKRKSDSKQMIHFFKKHNQISFPNWKEKPL